MMILILFLVLGSIVISTYIIGALFMIYAPNSCDSKGIWAGLYTPDRKPRETLIVIWCIGEILACCGFLVLTASLIYDKDEVSLHMLFFYCLFLITAAFWMPLALRGDSYYTLTIWFLFLTAAATWGLFVCAMERWGPSSFQAWFLLPLALHCTCMDLVFWCWTWRPSDMPLEQLAAFEAEKILWIEEDDIIPI